jgi:hypothetical protein
MVMVVVMGVMGWGMEYLDRWCCHEIGTSLGVARRLGRGHLWVQNVQKNDPSRYR